MLRHTRTALCIFSLAVGASSLACGGSARTDTPEQQAVTTSPTSGAKVTSVISSASLGESSANVQLAFIAEAASTAASVEVVSVVLVDATSGSVVDTLEASSPQVWNGGGYVAWNQRVTPGGDLRASYQLTAPAWSSIDPGGRNAYSRTFKLRVTLRIDGVDVLMQSTDLNREAQFQT
jgi:hypothetical protein